MERIGLSGSVLVAVLALGCGGGEQRSATSERVEVPPATTSGDQEGAGVAAMPAADCPMLVPETSVASSEVDGGAALTFTTAAGDRVEDLRARVRSMAARVEARGTGGMARHHGGASTPLPPVQAQVFDVDGGARMELRAIDPGEVALVREHVREHGSMMRAGTCPMMRGAG